MHNAPGSVIGNGLIVFAQCMQRDRMRREAYRQAAIEGQRQDAQDARIRALEIALRREQKRNDEKAIQAGAQAILARLRR